MSTATEPRPPEEAFWDRYNARAEFPFSTILSVLIHVAVGVLIVFVLFRLMDRGEDRATPNVRIIDVNGGDDDSGSGKIGSGGSETPLAYENRQPAQAAIDALPDPKMLPEIKDVVKKQIQVIDPAADLSITDANAAGLAMTEKTLRDKLLGLGSKAGSGDGAGASTTGQPGDGNGGTGANSSRARSLRWTLRFRTTSGRNYLDQVQSLGAVIAIPMPPNEDKLIVFEDLNNPSRRHVADDAETAKLAGWVKFIDVRRESVRQVGDALQLDFSPKSFWAFFPPKLEEELASKEKSYRNRRSDDIEETVFTVTIRSGGYDVIVAEQRVK